MQHEHSQTGLYASLWNIGIRVIKELESDKGILASGRNEVYGCVFGRDSLITALSLLQVYERTQDAYHLSLVRKILINLADLQGRVVNVESGEQPGKIIHEYRPDNHGHLTARPHKPWYVYGDGVMRNYDTADATALFLMAAHAYLRASGDAACITLLMPNISAALAWLEEYGDSNEDGFIDYHVPPERNCGGLSTHSWMDSEESLFFENNNEQPLYPIAPVEVQAYSYVAFRAWASYFTGRDAARAAALTARADTLKKNFNDAFVIEGRGGQGSLAFALDGAGRQLTSPRSSMGHCLWAVWHGDGAMPDCIIDERFIPMIARRLLRPDLYVPRAGVRTLSIRSTRYDANSYHNGSIWPHDTALISEGLEQFGFREGARNMRRALVSAYTHFNTPVELFVYSRGKYKEYKGETGQTACREQAWSAASLLSILRDEFKTTSEGRV